MSEQKSYIDRVKSNYVALAHAADVIARDAPRGLRPILRAAFFVGVSLLVVALVPFYPLIWWKQRRWFENLEREQVPVQALEDAARHVWTTTSPQAAVETIREVFERCRSTPEGVEVKPFGRFRWSVCGDTLANLLYRFESELGHWDKALEISDLMMGERRETEAYFPKWVLSRAKCLVRLGRQSEALALLMSYRDMYDAKAPVNQYLEEVRAGRG